MRTEQQRPIYIQIIDFMCEQILLQRWQAGDRLPSVRELAIQLEVNPNTAMRSYAYLEDKGIIRLQRGVGYFTTPQCYERVRAYYKQTLITRDWPYLKRKMELLGMTWDELGLLFNQEVSP